MAALCVATALAGAAPARAGEFFAIYTGKIYDGTDVTGIFGAPGGSLVGQTVTVAFTFNTATPGATLERTSDHAKLEGFGAASPGRAVVRIGNHSASITGDYHAIAEQRDEFGPLKYDDISHTVISDSVDIFTGNAFYADAVASVYTDLYNMVSNTNLAGPMHYQPIHGDDWGFGSFYLASGLGGASVTTDALGRFEVLDVVIFAPEPESWTLAILGFGMAGWALRRRSRSTVRVAFAA